MDKPLESDWKVFHKRVPEWRERYLDTADAEIASILSSRKGSPTDRFWEAKEKADGIANTLHILLDDHSRSKMDWALVLMYAHGFIGDDDLGEFSQPLAGRIRSASHLKR
ncbi:MAG: hypothetical protein WBX15_01640 [Thermoanaerobaculia bacterium]